LASEYVTRHGADFGYRTNDADNSLGPLAVVSADIVWGAPWTGAIRASDMTFHSHDGEWRFDMRAVASELAE
jgi:hypothetical protein